MTKEHGYLMIDHRASPGLPEDVARKSGFLPELAKECKLFEASTLTCAHCKTVVVKNPFRVREREQCFKCNNHYICDFCASAARHPDYVHVPFSKFADVVLAAPLGSSTQLLTGQTKED